MKKGKIIGAFFLIAALIMIGIPVPTAGAQEESAFKIESDILKSYVGTEKTVSVPDGVETIGRDAFKNNTTVEKVILPASTTKISPYAFWGCENLKEISLGSKIIHIGDYAFANCTGLEKMTIPFGARTIGIYSFEDCINLTDITIPYTVTDIHETSFDGCKRLVIHAEEGSYPDKYAQAFYLRQREMAEYEDVPDYDTTKPVVPSVDSDNIAVEPDVNGDGVLGTVHVVQNSAVVFIDNSASTVYEGMPNTPAPSKPENDYGFEELSNKILPTAIPKNSIVDGRVIADQAYYRDNTLTTLYIPDTIAEIGEFSFARSSLTKVALGANVEKIAYGAFYHCDALEQVHLSEAVMEVAPNAFDQTKWMNDFKNSTNGSDFLISGGVLVAYKGNGSAVSIPDGVRVIAAGCFAGHMEIGSVKLPESMRVVGEEAFYGCSSLSTVIYGGHEKAIQDRAFAKTSLTSAQLPNSLTELGKDAFDSAVRVSKSDAVKSTVADSARRLSNYSYRGTGSLGMGSVTTSGVPGARAELSGAKEAYTLYLSAVSADTFSPAFQRNLSKSVPSGATAYELVLSDQSGIAIDKLGKQTLTVVLPASYELLNGKAKAVILDRNGQLEPVTVKKASDGDATFLVIEMNYVSKLCIYPEQGSDSSVEVLQESDEEILQLSAPNRMMQEMAESSSPIPWNIIKWIAGGASALVGIFFFLKKS